MAGSVPFVEKAAALQCASEGDVRDRSRRSGTQHPSAPPLAGRVSRLAVLAGAFAVLLSTLSLLFD